MALALNHSGVVGGFNLSLADPLICLTAMGLMIVGRFAIPPPIVLFYVGVLIISGGTAVFLTPHFFGVEAEGAVIAEMVKLTVSLLFVLCGYSIARAGIHLQVLRWFAIGTSIIALAGIAMEVTGVRFLAETMYFGGLRFRGFMVDPNYWAILVNAAIVVIVGDRSIKAPLRAAMLASLVASIFLSASKTGLIALLCISLIMMLTQASRSRRRIEMSLVLLLGASVIAITWVQILNSVQSVVDKYVGALPQLKRLSALLQDPLGAASDGGSGRSATWSSGIAVIEESPVFGVGVGAYRAVNMAMFGDSSVAHNTYIQLAAEWGLPLAIVFFAIVGTLLILATKRADAHNTARGLLTVRNMIVVFLIGSISLSLNNARMFWLFLGILIYLVRGARVHADDGWARR